MPDGSKRQGISWETSPLDVAKAISKSLSERIVIAKVCDYVVLILSMFERVWNLEQVDGQLWDLERPLEKSVTLELLDFDHPEGIPHLCVSL